MGRIFIVGMGPGDFSMMTGQSVKALEEADIIVGYTLYVELIKKSFPDKEYATTPMKQEVERCKMCFDFAKEGRTVALVCSGDAGIYGMAAPIFELTKELDAGDVEIEVVPGITAASSGAAVLGAPLNHDFCVISLSDLLTPWETIEKRLRAAIAGDFAIALYNPSSHKRKDYLKKACEIMLMAGADGNRACGYVVNIGREGTESYVCSLEELKDRQVDMFTTVFIGNSLSEIIEGRLVTKRGYNIRG